MKNINPNSLSARGRKFFKLIEFDKEEQLIGEIRKHPFGLLVIYVTGGLITFSLMLLLIIAPLFIKGDPLGLGIDVYMDSIRSILVFAGLVLAALSMGMTAIAGYLYESNVVIITSDKITQLLYRTLFDRKISQLSIGDVQDTTVFQKGIFARIFNYGTLVIETAGEQSNYTFTYTPDPYETAKLIVGSHEENLRRYGN